ncbi:MAG: hypothetical protein WCV88_01880 [Patescibacteria group bacterium]
MIATLFQNTASFIRKHLLLLVIASAVPLLLSYVLLWLTIGVTINRIKSTASYDEFVQLFSFGNPLTYSFLITAVIVLAINIMGWIAGPLITIKTDQITLTNLLPKTVKYFWSYFVLSIIVIVGAILIEIGSFLIIMLISTVIGLFNIGLIGTTVDTLSNIVPSLALISYAILLQFAPYYLIDQNIEAWPAILKSINLVWHHLVSVVMRVLLIATIIILVSFVLQFIPSVGGILSYIFGTVLLTVYNYFVYQEFNGAGHSQ